MCGIIGYIGPRNVISVAIESLRRLEYRGYDSAGIAYFNEGQLEITRSVGKLFALEERLAGKRSTGRVGIGHTRWATHGRPNESNAHPHRAGSLALVHNGIIENYLPLRKMLQEKGRLFSSETDTEVLVHLIDDCYQQTGHLQEAVSEAMTKVRGSYAICLLSADAPDQIIAVRSGCPLVIGITDKECFAASDVPAFLPYARAVLYLEDGEMALLREGAVVEVKHGITRTAVTRKSQTVSWNQAMAEKGGYRHFMIKEIYEQPQAIRDTMRGRVGQDELTLSIDGLDLPQKINRVILIACGTSWHAALVGKFLIEELTHLPVEVDIASEFRYRSLHLSQNDLVIAISQSGETADTLAGLREAKKQGVATLALCNVVGSSISRECQTLYTHAGPEISVASTKAFTTQITALFLLAIQIGEKRGVLSKEVRAEQMRHLLMLPKQIEEVLGQEEKIVSIAKRLFRYHSFLYLGRGLQYPVALEGALKLKEISYIHAEGYAAGEMKHGPIALIDENMPVVFLAPKDRLYEKALSNMMEVRARGGLVILFTDEADENPVNVEETFIFPKASPYLTPIVATIPLQLLAYHVAVLRGNDIDQPRNLAKSVTVE